MSADRSLTPSEGAPVGLVLRAQRAAERGVATGRLISDERDHARVVWHKHDDTDHDALWLVIGTPPEGANTLEMSPERLAELYPDGPKALPPELS